MSKNNLPVRGRTQTGNGANLGFENQMWAAADKLRGHMDASEYKHVVLGLIFLKYITDAFQAKYKQLDATKDTRNTQIRKTVMNTRRPTSSGSQRRPAGPNSNPAPSIRPWAGSLMTRWWPRRKFHKGKWKSGSMPCQEKKPIRS